MKSPLAITLAAALCASTAAPALAQSYADTQYQERLRDWQAERDQYEARRQAYEARREAYEADRWAYEHRNDYGYAQTPYGRNVAYADPYSHYRSSPCEVRDKRADSSRRTAGTLFGALIGGALGAGVASDKVQTEGAVLGAVVGGTLGNAIASESNKDRYVARCDRTGYYYNYDQTYPYRESDYYRGRNSGRYDYSYYTRERCRLAVAPADFDGRTDYRYVRVCPDRNGRYRVTD